MHVLCAAAAAGRLIALRGLLMAAAMQTLWLPCARLPCGVADGLGGYGGWRAPVLSPLPVS